MAIAELNIYIFLYGWTKNRGRIKMGKRRGWDQKANEHNRALEIASHGVFFSSLISLENRSQMIMINGKKPKVSLSKILPWNKGIKGTVLIRKITKRSRLENFLRFDKTKTAQNR